MNNFGAIRDATTLEWLGPAPIFDCGTSLWFDNLFRWGMPEDKAPSKPFAENHAEQIKLVSAFDWLDMDALAGTAEMLRTTFEAAPNFMEIGRVDIICEAFENRIRLLDEHIVEFTIKPGDNEPEMLME